MKQFVKWMTIICLVFSLTACKKPTSETSSKAAETPHTENKALISVTPVENKEPAQESSEQLSQDKRPPAADNAESSLPALTNDKVAPTNTESEFDSNAWLGTWNWDNSDQYNTSKIAISTVSEKALVFSLNAFHVTNIKTMDGSNGIIDKKVALFEGDEAIFRDDELQFELRMNLKNKQLVVTTNNGNYFGAGVVVDGSYSRGEFESNTSDERKTQNDNLIVPGKSIGKLILGMTQADVTKILGKPTVTENNVLTYKSSKNYIKLYFKEQTLKQVEFTSPSFSTSDGINTSNFEEQGKNFDIKGFQWRFLQVRYDSIKGGLSFFVMNADVPDDNTEYSRSSVGYLYEGQSMYEDPISGANWETLSP